MAWLPTFFSDTLSLSLTQAAQVGAPHVCPGLPPVVSGDKPHRATPGPGARMWLVHHSCDYSCVLDAFSGCRMHCPWLVHCKGVSM